MAGLLGDLVIVVLDPADVLAIVVRDEFAVLAVLFSAGSDFQKNGA